MHTAGFFIAAADGGIAGIQEQDVIRHFLFVQRFQCLIGFLNRMQAADIHHDRNAAELVLALLGKVQDTGQKARRDIINAEKSDIFQRVDRHGLACAGKAGYDQKVHPVVPLSFSGAEYRSLPGRHQDAAWLFHHADLAFQGAAGFFQYDLPHLLRQADNIRAGGITQVDHKAAVLFTDGCPAHAETAQAAVLD